MLFDVDDSPTRFGGWVQAPSIVRRRGLAFSVGAVTTRPA